jgi:hypothetical protein
MTRSNFIYRQKTPFRHACPGIVIRLAPEFTIL